MASTSHPTSTAPAPAPSFVVALFHGGLRRGMAGPFETEAAAGRWAVELLEGEASWTWEVEPVVSPAALPLARERRVRPPRHLTVVR